MNNTHPGHASVVLYLEHFQPVVFTKSKLVELDHTRQASHLRLIALHSNYTLVYTNIQTPMLAIFFKKK